MKRKKTRLKKALLFLLLACAVTAAIHIVHACTVDRTLAYTEISYSSPQVAPALDGYTIAFVTDTHAIPGDELRAVVEQMNSRGVDLLLLGGDFPSGEAAWRSMEILSETNADDGIFGVEGNHDSWNNLKDAMVACGIVPLDNTGHVIQDGFYLAGVQDLWNRVPDVSQAIGGARPEDFVLLLSHNPDISMNQDMTVVDLVLSGHTHGGHITFFGIYRPLMFTVSDYGQRFGGGWAKGQDDTDVFVSRGVGQVELGPRVFAQPEVIYLTLEAAR